MRTAHAAQLTWLIAGTLLALPQSAWAGDEIRTSGDVNVTGGYSNNPFSETTSDPGSAEVEINALPKIRLINEHSVLSLEGLIDYEHFFRRYSDKTDYRGTLDYAATPTSQLTVHGKIDYDSAIIGGLETQFPVDLTQPQPPPTTGPDLALFGTQTRRRSLESAGDVAYALSAYSTLTANAYYDIERYGGGVSAANYDGYGGGAGYSRRFSQQLQLGLQASVGRYVYQGLQGNAQVYTLQATGTYTFNSHWNLDGALGGTYSDRTIGGKTTNVTGHVVLCRKTERTTLCLNAGQSVLPTGVTGTVATKTAGASYSYLISEHSTLSFSGTYSNNSEPINGNIPGSSYFSTSLSYDRTLRERVHVVGTVRYRDITGGIGDRPADYGGTLGILVKLGDYR